MKEKIKKERRYPMSYPALRAASISVMFVAVLLAVVRVVAVVCDYEAGIQYFKLGSVWASAFNGGAVALVICAFLFPLLADLKRFPRSAPATGRAESVLLSLSAVLLAAFSALEIYRIIRAHGEFDAYIPGQSFFTRSMSSSLICAVLSLVLAAYFIMTALGKPTDPRLRALAGCFGIIAVIFRLLSLYFDTSAPINSPIKTLEQMAGSAVMLYLASELRLSLSDARPRFTVQAGIASFVLLLPASLSRIVGAACGKLPFDSDLVYALFSFVFVLYIGSRVKKLLFMRNTPVAETAQAAPETDGQTELTDAAPEETPDGETAADEDPDGEMTVDKTSDDETNEE